MPVPDDQVSRFGVIAGEAVAENVWKVDSLVEKPALEDAPSESGGCSAATCSRPA